MKTRILWLVGWLASFCLFGAEDVPLRLLMSDGQLLSSPIKVFVAGTNLSEGMSPHLRLVGLRLAEGTNDADQIQWKPFLVAGGQSREEKLAGQPVHYIGTLLMFNLGPIDLPWFKTTTRLTPVFSWKTSDKANAPEISLIGDPVYLGRRGPAFLYTALLVLALVGIIAGLSYVKKKNVFYLIAGDDGYMSLWRAQLAAWTIAVGGMVFWFGILRLEVPRIPESLVALMGMSVITGSLSTVAAHANRQHLVKKGKAPKPNQEPPRFADLISSYAPELDKVVLSVSKAQMIFWTGIILVLFITKSLLSGELWEVPWELVTLTGVSQAGYVSDKALKRKAD